MSDAQIQGRPTTWLEEGVLADVLRQHMVDKLAENRGKAHWRTPGVPHTYLLGRLFDEVHELKNAVRDNELSRNVWREAADVANFAAMIADLYEKGPFDE